MGTSNGDDHLQQLLRVWASKCRDGQLPPHANLRPNELLFMLPDLCLLNAGTDDSLRFRLVGTEIAERLGHDPTGAPLAALPAEAATELRELCNATLEARWPMVGSGRLHFGEVERLVEILCLPFTDPDGRISVLLLGFRFRAWTEVAVVPPAGALAISDVAAPDTPGPLPGLAVKVVC